jgi:hypothetical protein
MLCNYTEKGLKQKEIYTILNASLYSRQRMESGSGEFIMQSAQVSAKDMIGRLCTHILYRSETLLPKNFLYSYL